MKIKCKILITFLILVQGLVCNGQSTEFIINKEQNEEWFKVLDTLHLDKQLDFIKTRILKDTLVYNSKQNRTDRVILENLKSEEKLKGYMNIAEGRILYLVRYKYKPSRKFQFLDFQWNNWTSASKIKKFHDFLSIDKIKGIEIITDDKREMANFGAMDGFGVIVFELNKKKYMKDFNKNIREK